MIWIDNRAGSKELIKYPPLTELAELCRLDSADICFTGNGHSGPVLVGIEVKSIWDLLSSSGTGRLQATQLPAMLESYDINWLLYYGDYRPGAYDSRLKNNPLQVQRGSKWHNFSIGPRAVPYGYLEGILLDLTAVGVNVKQVADIRQAATWIGVLHRWQSKPWDKHKGLRTFDKSQAVSLMPGMDPKAHLIARVAAQLPGVGFERSVEVCKHFTSVRQMINAGPKEWGEVKGIGKVIAKAVDTALD